MRAQLVSVTLLGVLLAVLAILVAGGRAWLDTSATTGFHQVVERVPEAARALTLRYTGGLGTQAVSADYGRRLSRSLGSPVRNMVRRPWPAAMSPSLDLQLLPQHDVKQRIVTVAALPAGRESVRWVAGHAPDPGTHKMRLPAKTAADLRAKVATVLQVGVSRASARALGVHPGSFAAASLIYYLHGPVPLEVTGVYQPTVRHSGLDAVGSLRVPTVTDHGTKIITSMLAADPATVLGAQWLAPATAQWTFPGGDTVPAGRVHAVAQQVARLNAGGALDLAPGPRLHAEVVTGLGQIAEDFLAAKTSSDALITLPATAVLACALLALALATSVLSRRRAHASTLLAARGAGLGQLLVLRGGEALLLAVPAAGAGVAAAAVVRWGAPAGGDVATAAATAVIGAGLATALGLPPGAGRSAGSSRRAALRVAVQALLVVMAALGSGVLASRQRVQAGDPFLTLVPVLIAVAATIVATQVLPRLLDLLRRLAARRVRLGPLLAATEALHAARTRVLPVLLVVLAAGTAVLALALSATVPRGIGRAAWEQVGADVAVHPEVTLGPAMVGRVAALPRTAAVAAARVDYGMPIAHAQGSTAVTLVAVDPRALARVRRDAPARLPLSALSASTASTTSEAVLGGRDSTVPAIVSSGLVSSGHPLVIHTGSGALRLHVVGRTTLVPGLADATSAFVLLPMKALGRAGNRPEANVLLVAGHPRRAALLTALADKTGTA
ncbi:MAG: hypothetical protein ACRDPB_05900, partial [Nocardioidaceae bacterium]